jgi:hypothetical protein
MCSVHKLIQRKIHSEQGFVLIVALMAIAVLIAVGFFALTIISGDLMIVSRLACERKAFSAAESGAHAIYQSIDLENIAASNVEDVQIDPQDSHVTYSARTQATNQQIMVSGDNTTSMAPVFNTVVTGKNASDGSSVSIIIGLTPPPMDATTEQNPPG